MRHGSLGLAAHGGQHFIKTRLYGHDIETLRAALTAYDYAIRGRPLPNRPKFDKKLRQKMRSFYESITVAIANQNQVQTGTQRVPGE